MDDGRQIESNDTCIQAPVASRVKILKMLRKTVGCLRSAGLLS